MVGYSSGASRLRSWQLYPIVLFLFLALLLTGGRTSFVSMLLVVSFFILRAFSDDTGQKKVSLAIASVIMLLIMLATSQYENHYVHSESHDSWERSSLWKSAIDANDSFLFGVGTGDYKKELNSYFHEHGMEEFEKGELQRT